MLPRTVLATVTIAAAAIAVAAQPAAARPKPPKTAKFTATFEASYKTTWNQPKRLTGGSACGGLNYTQGSGEESWTIKTRKAHKLLAYKTSYGASLLHGTWDPQAEEAFTIDAFGVHQRSGRVYWTIEPGECGGEFKVQPKDPDEDCGTRLPEYGLRFDGTTKYYPNLMRAPHQRKEKTWFSDCDLRLADELVEGAWPRVEEKLPVKKLFGRAKTVVVEGKGDWDNADEPSADLYTTSSSLRWKLTLTRA